MINKKRQELLINNLKSISAEVRQRSLQQLMQIPTFSTEEKLGYARQLLQDSEEEVRNYAQAVVNELSGHGGAAPATPAPAQAPAPNPASPDFSLPVEPVLSAPEPVPQTFAPAGPETAPSLMPDLQAFDIAAETAAPIFPTSAAPEEAFTSEPFSSSPPENASFPSLPSLEEVAQPVAQAAPANPVALAAIDEPIDPSLPDLKKINDIPTLLQHIKTLSGQKPSGYLVQLLQLSESQLEEVALSALQALLNLKDRRVPPQILFRLANETYSSQRRFLMLKIIMDTEMGLDTSLLERILLNEKDVIVKSGLVKVFARNSREKGINTIIACLTDPDPRVRANTVEVVEEQGILGCEQQIIELLQDPENRVKVNAAKFLVKNGYQQAFLTLRSMLVSSEVWLRDSVIFALGEIGDQASLTLLKAALKDPNQGIRLSVLKSLAKINNATSRQVLKAASGDPDPVVAQVANSLFEKVKDTPLREDVKLPTSLGAARPQPAPQPIPQPVPPVAQPAPQPIPQPVPPVAQPAPQPIPQPVPPVAQPAPQPIPQPIPQPVPPVAQPSPQPIPQPVLPVAQPAPQPIPQPVPPPASAPPAAPVLPPGAPSFAKPRSAEVYARIISNRPEDWQVAARDMAFVMGDDQTILVETAYQHQSEQLRLAAVKILSRKRTPEARAILEQMAGDANELVRSLVEKTLLLNK